VAKYAPAYASAWFKNFLLFATFCLNENILLACAWFLFPAIMFASFPAALVAALEERYPASLILLSCLQTFKKMTPIITIMAMNTIITETAPIKNNFFT